VGINRSAAARCEAIMQLDNYHFHSRQPLLAAVLEELTFSSFDVELENIDRVMA
jgi:hypothetical protein